MGTANKENVMNVKKGRKKKWGKNVLQHVIMAKKRKKEQQFYQNKSKVCVCVAQVWFYSQNQHLWETDSERQTSLAKLLFASKNCDLVEECKKIHFPLNGLCDQHGCHCFVFF